MTTLIFIRHARSLGNQLGLCSGQRDYPLIEKGHEQAKILSVHLKKNYPIEAIYTSDLVRTIQTAQPTAQVFGLELQADPRFREVCLGEWEGQSWQAVGDADPELYTSWQNMNLYRSDRRPKGAECFEEIWERADSAIRDVVSRHRGKCVAIFSHSRFMRSLAYRWAQKSPQAAKIISEKESTGFFSVSVTVATFDDRGEFSELLLCNDREYLKGTAVDQKVAAE